MQGRQVLRGNRSIDADRPLPISNVCHVVQSTNAANKSSYKCVRVEFFEQEGDNKKVNLHTIVYILQMRKQLLHPCCCILTLLYAGQSAEGRPHHTATLTLDEEVQITYDLSSYSQN